MLFLFRVKACISVRVRVNVMVNVRVIDLRSQT